MSVKLKEEFRLNGRKIEANGIHRHRRFFAVRNQDASDRFIEVSAVRRLVAAKDDAPGVRILLIVHAHERIAEPFSLRFAYMLHIQAVLARVVPIGKVIQIQHDDAELIFIEITEAAARKPVRFISLHASVEYADIGV